MAQVIQWSDNTSDEVVMRYKWCIGQTTHTARWSDHKSGAMVRPCKWYNGEIIDAVQWSDYTSGAVIRPYIRGAVVRSYK